ncbi:guanine nucleotide-binding protein G(I)/G(S)/G(O) subunit gamma-13 isoform X1 [Callorhinus ursinus]|uniref:Guanine nucleotide-binding protein G(I)/G(S)/G(O) subunit gamma-13 n=1 Tax=Zalophus californianus TaxID=9704 RepID=A0A6J2EKE7_ZALCA|nr:guanine nucleotide-binding protein G(I)/G(S)/G(O) subunit gamma-13 isoform X1 [Zalophus californianus]
MGSGPRSWRVGFWEPICAVCLILLWLKHCPFSLQETRPCPRLATSEAPDAMEEWDVPQMKKEVESLKYQLAFKREMSSKTIPELLKWIEDGIPKDPFLNPDLMKNNPWVEKGKCAIL